MRTSLSLPYVCWRIVRYGGDSELGLFTTYFKTVFLYGHHVLLDFLSQGHVCPLFLALSGEFTHGGTPQATGLWVMIWKEVPAVTFSFPSPSRTGGQKAGTWSSGTSHGSSFSSPLLPFCTDPLRSYWNAIHLFSQGLPDPSLPSWCLIGQSFKNTCGKTCVLVWIRDVMY